MGKGAAAARSPCSRGPQDVGGVRSPQAAGEGRDNAGCYPEGGLRGLVREAAGRARGLGGASLLVRREGVGVGRTVAGRVPSS